MNHKSKWKLIPYKALRKMKAMKMMTLTIPEPRTCYDIDLSADIESEEDSLKRTILQCIQIFFATHPDVRSFEITELAEFIYMQMNKPDPRIDASPDFYSSKIVELLFSLARRGEFEMFVQAKDENGNRFGPVYSTSAELKALNVSENQIAFCVGIKGVRNPRLSTRHVLLIALLASYLLAVVYWFQIKG
jgi:hypothetical protein